MENQNIIIYNTSDGKASVSLYAKDGMIWMNQNQLAELFDTSKQNIGQHITSVLNDSELEHNSVVKNYFTTELFSLFDKKRKTYEARLADREDLEDLKSIEKLNYDRCS